MEWTRSETIALAAPKCTLCHGAGLRTGRGSSFVACNCVFRSIFRQCFNRFRECVEKEKHLSRVTLEFSSRRNSRSLWGRKDEEYIADFYLVSKRNLTEQQFTIFKYHFLLGADWRLCCRKLKLDRGTFFHEVYRIEEKLGRVYRELQPYALFPLDEYFSGDGRLEPAFTSAKVIPIGQPRSRLSSLVPVKKAA